MIMGQAPAGVLTAGCEAVERLRTPSREHLVSEPGPSQCNPAALAVSLAPLLSSSAQRGAGLSDIWRCSAHWPRPLLERLAASQLLTII